MKKEKEKLAGKRVATALVALAVIYAIQCADIFFFRNVNLLGGNLLSPTAAILITVAASLYLKYSLRRYCFAREGLIIDTLWGMLFTVISVGICIFIGMLRMKFVNKSFSYPGLALPFERKDGILGLALDLALYAVAVVIQALFKEMFFRGFFISQLSQKMNVHKAFPIQALLYTFGSIPLVVSMLMSEKMSFLSAKEKIIAVLLYFAGEYLCGFRWGMYYTVNGNVWLSLSEHIVQDILVNCISLPGFDFTVRGIMLGRLLVNIVNTLMCLPLYFRRDTVNENIAAEVKLAREMSDLTVDNYSPSPLKRFVKTLDKNSAAKVQSTSGGIRSAVQETGLNMSDVVKISRDDFFKNLDDLTAWNTPSGAVLGETDTGRVKKKKIQTQTDVVREVKKETDSDAGNKNSVQKNKSASESIPGEAAGSDGNETQKSDISKLVQNYFNDEFNKHTFN